MTTSFHSKGTVADPLVRQSPASPPRPTAKGEWWFRLTAPQEPENATFAQREAARRGRLASMTIVFISLFTMIPIPDALIQGNVGFLVVLVITLLLNAFALFVLNRRGYLAAAGWLVVTVLEAGFALSFLAMPHGVSLELLRGFDVLAESLMVVVAFFPPRSVFVVMAINILFTVAWLNFGPHTSDISQLLKSNPYNLFYPSISLELFETILAFLWVSSATNAIAALDRSQEIVALERREIELQEEQLRLKQQLEDGIKQIQETHRRAANGDFTARAPLNRENILWQLAYSLNNLLARLQSTRELQVKLDRTEKAVRMLAAYMRAAKANQEPIPPLQRTGTAIDELIVELTVPKPNTLRPNRATHPHPPLNEGSHNSSFRENRGTDGQWRP